MNYSDTYQIEILKEGEFARRHFVILSIGYYPCAYVEFFDEIDEDSLKWENIPCHGDVTYQGSAYWNEELKIIKKDNRYYIGWDYGHKYDWVGYKTDEENILEGNKKWTLQEVFSDVRRVIKYLNRFYRFEIYGDI